MKEVYPNLFVGSDNDVFEFGIEAEKRCRKSCGAVVNSHISGYYVHAAKEPWHRQALGYKTRGAPKNDPEYLFARRRGRLILNLVDTPKHWMIPEEPINEALELIRWVLKVARKPIIVHCNRGYSRGPSIALMYLIQHTDFSDGLTFEQTEEKFKKLYPDYLPSGIREKTIKRYEMRLNRSS